jgi:hypothetical protein
MTRPRPNDDYSVMVVKRRFYPPQWEWEICRNGEPLPVRARDASFKSKSAAEAAGKIELRQFLEILAWEQSG